MEIKGFIQNSLLEWEGNVSCVVFLPFCNFRCRYCHATHLLESGELEGIQKEQILRYMRKNSEWLDSAVITGGEPTLQENELLEFIAEIHQTGLDVMVETNGTRPLEIDRLVTYAGVEKLSMDVKAPLVAEDYGAVTQTDVDVGALKRSIDNIISSGVDHEFRVTVVPDIVGTEELERIGPELEGAKCVAVQNFQPDHCLDSSLHDLIPYEPSEMDEMGEVMEKYVDNVIVRGRDRAPRARSA